MPQNLIWLVKWSDRYWRAVIASGIGQPPSRAGRGRAIQPASFPWTHRLRGRQKTVAALADMPADTLGVPMLDGGRPIQPQPFRPP